MPQQWPTAAPSVSPGTHDPVATQAYQAGGGDYFMSGFYSYGLPTFSATSQSLAASSLFIRPFQIPVRRNFDRIGISVTAAGTAGALIRLGIYSPSYALLLDAGTAAADSTGVKEIVISQTLDPGIYWVATVAQVAGCSINGTSGSSYGWVQQTGMSASTQGSYRPSTTTTGALPSSFTPSGTLLFSTVPLVGLRAV